MGGHSLQGDRRLITPAQQVESILIKDIVIPPELQSSLSAAAQQRRLGEAKVLAASAEVDAARLMREAADILSSPAALQIRQLESLQVRRPSSLRTFPGANCSFRNAASSKVNTDDGFLLCRRSPRRLGPRSSLFR